MTALARTLFRSSEDALVSTSLKTIAMFCAVALFVCLLFATYGLDLSPGFFDLRSRADEARQVNLRHEVRSRRHSGPFWRLAQPAGLQMVIPGSERRTLPRSVVRAGV
jgi:hypothetical protein